LEQQTDEQMITWWVA